MATKIWVGTDTGNEGDYATAANWSPSGVPEAGDTVYIEDSAQSIIDGLDQSAVALTAFNVGQNFTGYIGTDSAYLQIAASAVNIGYHNKPGTPSGSGKIKLDLGSGTAATVTIDNAGTPVDSNKPAIMLKAANASTVINVRKGKVGVAVLTAETSTVGTINIGYVSSRDSDADVYIGSGVTLTTLVKNGGSCILGCAATTVTNESGSFQTMGSGAITTLNLKGGVSVLNSTGTITTLNVIGTAEADLTRSTAARTITTLKIGDTAFLKFDKSIITLTNKVDQYDASGILQLRAS